MSERDRAAGPEHAEPERVSEGAPDERCIASNLLLGQADRLWITHAGERYCLRLTRRNRLILTK